MHSIEKWHRLATSVYGQSNALSNEGNLFTFHVSYNGNVLWNGWAFIQAAGVARRLPNQRRINAWVFILPMNEKNRSVFTMRSFSPGGVWLIVSQTRGQAKKGKTVRNGGNSHAIYHEPWMDASQPDAVCD